MSKRRKIDFYIFDWNNRHPYDYKWRKKYNIPFGSIEHKGISFIDQVFDLREDELVEELRKERKEAKEAQENESLGLGNKKVVNLDKEQIDREFEDLKIEDYLPSDIIKEKNDSNILDD